MSAPLCLPTGEVPPPPPSRMTYDQFVAWNTAQLRLLAEAGLLEARLNDPARRPVDVPFVLRPTAR